MSRLAGVVAMLLATRASADPGPPSPTVAGGPRAFGLYAGHPAQVRVAWNSVPGATHYRATWLDVDHDVTTPALELTEDKPGRRPLAIVAIDKDGHASAPARVMIDIVPIVAIAPGSTDSAQSNAYAIGTRFSSPGTTCSLGTGASVSEIQAAIAGRMWLACGAFSAPVIIAPVVLAASDVAPLVRETATTIHVTVASVAPLGDRLDIEAIGELDLGEAQRTAGGFDLTVTPRAIATTVGLRIVAGTLPLGTVDLPLSDRVAAPAEPPAPTADWFALDAGALLGIFIPQSTGVAATNLGHPTANGDALGTGGSFAAHVGYFPVPRAGLEADLAIGPTGYAGGGGTSALLVERLQVAIRAVEDRRFGIRVLLGADLLTELARHGTSAHATDGALHYGAAFTVEIADRAQLRIEAMHLITSARDAGYASSFIAQVGVVMRFGRLDRW